MSTLSAREGYRLWAPCYPAETAITHLENRLVTALALPLAGCRLLDVGCGTGQRLRQADAALAVGVDLTPEMLARTGRDGVVAAADVRALPFGAASFDVVWCRLVMGYVRELREAYVELSRVCRPGGTVVVTDFHPDAVAAGHRRTFRDATGHVHEIANHPHPMTAHRAVAGGSGLDLSVHQDGDVGPLVRPFYVRAGRLAAYRDQQGTHLVFMLVFRRAT